MTAIWSTDPEGGWRVLSKVGFPDEATLHNLVEQAPQLLPLAGSPPLAVVGREVRLGSGSADLLALEPSGRLAIIEVKLAMNAEARRAVVAQVLAYAARLHGMTPDHLENEVLFRHLRSRGFETLSGAAIALIQDDSDSVRRRFEEGLAESLSEGRFRLVIVLDEAPEDLVHLVGYLEYVTDRLIIDLVTVAAYEVGGRQLIVPSRVEPEHFQADRAMAVEPTENPRTLSPGIDAFRRVVNESASEQRTLLDETCTWAASLEARQLATLTTHVGSGSGWTTLRVQIPGDMGLVNVNCGSQSASIQLWQTVFDRRAPKAKKVVEEIIGSPIGQGTAIRQLPEQFLEKLTAAYEEAASGRLTA